jgi:hypothetical protein
LEFPTTLIEEKAIAASAKAGCKTPKTANGIEIKL